VNNLLGLAVLFAAVAAGWWLGRRSAQPPSVGMLPGQYYKGLNYLLDDRPDGAVDAFINALEVNSETLETHIALGNLLRKRGEVDRAIRIHQNLLARPSLPRAQVHQAHLELARDYISAGLFDRAERLLKDLVSHSPEQRRASLRYLLEIFQSQREWQQAIDTATALLPRRGLLGGGGAAVPLGANRQPVNVPLAHYHCELADDLSGAGRRGDARRELQRALSQDRHCVRASLMLAQLDFDDGEYRQAIRWLKRVGEQDPDLLAEAVPQLRACYHALNDEQSLCAYLQDCLQMHPGVPLLLATTEELGRRDGAAAAAAFLSHSLSEQPSLRGLARLLQLQLRVVGEGAREQLEQLRALLDKLTVEQPTYRCSHCGFAGRQLHWFCPGCKHWGTVKPLRGGRTEAF
jgi:lipopolysaccharide biosynthesis regulator YciM